MKIHTGTNFANFGDGFFSVWNPSGETEKLEITTSNINDGNNYRNTRKIPVKMGQFQCIQVYLNSFKNLILFLKVTQIKNEATQKLDHTIKFMGETIFEKAYSENEVFTGQLGVWISDQWHSESYRNKITQFSYEILD